MVIEYTAIAADNAAVSALAHLKKQKKTSNNLMSAYNELYTHSSTPRHSPWIKDNEQQVTKY